MTRAQRHTLSAVHEADARDQWFRARSHGERVVLANLFRKRVLERRAWRGVEGDPDAAHEYRPRRREQRRPSMWPGSIGGGA